jgi:hypothetical protein
MVKKSQRLLPGEFCSRDAARAGGGNMGGDGALLLGGGAIITTPEPPGRACRGRFYAFEKSTGFRKSSRP